METKEVKVGTKMFKVHELLSIEFDAIQQEEDITKRVVATIKKSADLSDDDYAKLTLKERSEIQKAMGILNGWEKKPDFQKPDAEKKTQKEQADSEQT